MVRATRPVRGRFTLKGMICTSAMSACLVSAFLWSSPLVFAGQGPAPKSETSAITTARPAAASVDPRFRSPRATARTFLIAMNRTEDDPHQIEEAVACLDLSGIPADQRDRGADGLRA